MLRLIALGISVLIPSLGYAIHEIRSDVIDPMWLRWLLSLWILAVLGLTYVKPNWSRTKDLWLGSVYLLTAWYLALTVVNHYEEVYAVGVLMVLPAAGSIIALFADRLLPIRLFYSLTGAAVLGTLPWTGLPTADIIYYAGCVIPLIIIMALTQERKLRAETELRDSRRKYRSLFEDSNDAIVAHDLAGTILTVNPKAAEVFGYEPDEMIGRSVLDLFGAEVRPRVRRRFEAVGDGAPFRTTEQCVRRDDSVFTADLSASIINLEGNAMVRSMIRDVTEREERERELRLLSKAVEEASETILITKLDEEEGVPRIAYTNAAFEALTGYSEAEVLDRTPTFLLDPEEAPGIIASIDAELKNGRPWTGFARHYRKDGSSYFAQMSISPVQMREGGAEYWVSVHRDITEERELRRQLRAERDLLEQTQRLAGAWSLELPGEEVSWSEEVYRMHQIPPSREMDLEAVLDMYPEPSVKRLERVVNEASEKGTSFDIEVELSTNGHDTRWVRVVGGPTTTDDGEVCRVSGAIQDITARKRAEREQAQLAAIVESSHNAIISTDREGIIQTWNPAAEELYGYAADAAVGRDISLIIPSAKLAEQAEMFDVIEQGRRVDSVETVRVREDGTSVEVVVNLSPILDGDDRVTGVAGIVQDLTERRRIERQIKVQASALEATANAIVITNRYGQITWVNHAFTELTGYTLEDVEGETPEMLHANEEDEHYYQHVVDTIRSGEVWQGELMSRRKDGSAYAEEQTVTPVSDEDGEIHHYIAVKHDITERKQRKAELVEAKEKAEEMNRLKSSFLANMSHEIRTPLASIIGYADLLKSESPSSSSDFIAHIDRIQHSGERLLNTLNSVLDLAQLESGAMEPVSEVFDACAELRGVADSLRLQADRKNIELRLDCEHDSMLVYLDKGIFARAATNLLHNAIKFTDEGYVRLGCSRTTGQLVLEIEDTGIGMDETFLEDLFSPFRQESTGLNRRYEGSGLGLTITQHLVELAEGTIDVSSEKGEGTVFTVRLPNSYGRPDGDNANGPAALFASADGEALPDDQRVLIVDDDPAVRDLLGEMLPPTYRVDTAKAPEQALSLGSDGSYDLILMDINLKGRMDGVDILTRLHKDGLLDDTVTIAVTAYALPGDDDSFLSAGFTDYLSKPFTRNELYATIGRCLDGGHR